MEGLNLKRLLPRIWMRLKYLLRYIKVLLLRTDKARWRSVEKETSTWDERNRIIASRIPKSLSVLDVGAGAQTLRNHLLDNRYVACDVIRRPGVLYCDLNDGIFPSTDEKFDYVVCSGVIEYLLDPEAVISKLSEYGQNMILSYAPLTETYKKNKRVIDGWKNHLTSHQLETIFRKLNLTWEILEYWDVQTIYFLSK